MPADGLREALVSGIAYAIARAPVPSKTDTARDVAGRLAPLVIESGYLSVIECVSCHSPIVYRPDDPVIHVGCAIADESEAAVKTDPASELGRLLAERDRLIGAGVDPSELAVPLPVEGPYEELNDAP